MAYATIDTDDPTASTAPDVQALNRLFRPASVAIVGASPVEGTARNSLVKVLRKHGFTGDVFPVNPKQTEIEGLKCYPSLAALPQSPDLAMIITPAATVPGLIRECGAAGIAGAMVFSSGFEETASGKAVARELSQAVRESGVTMLGPNCQGIWSIRDKTILTFGPAARRLDRLAHSPVAVISQSGALGGAIANHFQANGIGSSYIISVGNETTTNMLDCLAWAIEQDDVRTVVLYIEGLDDGARIMALSERARARGVQIVAIKAGVSELGQSATASHTGKIASAGSIYAHVLEQAGVILVDSMAEIFATARALVTLPDPRQSDDPLGGAAIVSTSGGACALLADHCDANGVPLATFSPHISNRLIELLPEFARTQNPVDVTGQIRAVPDLLENTLRTIASDPRTEVLVLQLSSSGQSDITENRALLSSIARQTGLPVVVSLAGETIDPGDIAQLREAGVLVASDPAETIRTIHRVYQRRDFLARPPQAARPLGSARAAPNGWSETMAFLSDVGIGSPSWAILGPDADASTACQKLSFPVVAKALPEDAEHKTELGLVRLKLGSMEQVAAAASDFRKIMGKPEAGILVQEMAGGGVETVLSCLRGTDFGPVLNIGLGGVAVELFRDVAHVALPAGRDQILRALQGLKLWHMLVGFRGSEPADIDALLDAAVALGDRFLATPDLHELEINPLIVRSKGQGLLALDALLGTTR